MKKRRSTKKDNNKALIIGGALAAGALIAIANEKKRKVQTVTNISYPSATVSNSSQQTATSVFPLKFGSRGAEVANLQKALFMFGSQEVKNILNQTSYKNNTWDGVWGSGTEKAVNLSKLPSVINEDSYKRIITNTVALMPGNLRGWV
jgi:hypothetical protein